MRIIAIIAATCFWAAQLLAQGPFDGYLKGKKMLDVAASLSGSRADEYFAASGQKYGFQFRGQSVGLFAEGGLTKNLDLIATLNYVSSSGESGLQDGGIFAKMRVFKTKLSGKGDFLSVLGATGANFPVGKYEPQAVGAIGKRAVEVPAKLLVHLETRWHFFVTASAGQHIRLDKNDPADIETARLERPGFSPAEPPNFQTFLVKIGFPAKHFYADAWFESQKTVGGTDFVPDVFDLPGAHGVSYQQFGGTLYYSDNGRTGFFVSGAKIFSGRNISPVRRISGGIVRKFDFSKKK